MKLAIEDNCLEIYGANDEVAMHLTPRRSCPGEQTRITLEVEGWPEISFLPEAVAGAPAPNDWIWRGDHAGAQRLAELAVATLCENLKQGQMGTGNDRPAAWRQQLMDGLCAR
jgi:hypothetical protein